MKRRSSTSVKKILHSGHTFSTRDSFPPGVLPTKRHVIERILHLKNFQTFNAANEIAREIYDRWVWCNVYPIHLYTISKKVQSFVNCFSALDRWSKKKRGEAFLQKEKEFMSTIDEIFDVFCADDKQRRILEKQHGLKMTDDDYAFYKDQTSKRVGKCVDAVVPSTSADIQFLRCSRPLQPHPEPPTCSSVTSVTSVPESALDYLSDSSSTNTDQTQSSAASKFVSQSMPYENQNRMIWSNLARMSERFHRKNHSTKDLQHHCQHRITVHDKLTVVGTDGTAAMTGKFNGCIRKLEELLNKPLQWVFCLLHTNELPLRHVFTMLDGTTNSPDTFAGPIGKCLTGDVSNWPVAANFKSISNPQFVQLPESVVNDLSTDQHYAYKICSAIIMGVVDSDLQYLKVGPIVHSRWLTLGCRILRYYVSVDEPSSNLETLTKFCLQVYFPSWFEIKLNSQLTCGSRNFFNLVQRILQVPDEAVRKTALK